MKGVNIKKITLKTSIYIIISGLKPKTLSVLLDVGALHHFGESKGAPIPYTSDEGMEIGHLSTVQYFMYKNLTVQFNCAGYYYSDYSLR